jgi:site-specific recombinase XerD
LIPARLRQLGRQLQIVPLSPHRLRHTLATFLINQGMSITALQKFLGIFSIIRGQSRSTSGDRMRSR